MTNLLRQSACPLCDGSLQESKSLEHVIPNSIGGRLKVSGFICDDCNHRTGHDWDAVLARQLNHWCLFFNIAREAGSPPDQRVTTSSGQELLLRSDGTLIPNKPSYSEKPGEAGPSITASARTIKELRTVLAQAKMAYPNIDIDALLDKARESFDYPEGYVGFQSEVGGPEAGRSIVKSSLAAAHFVGISLASCKLALRYLRDTNAEPCFGFYYECDVLTGRPAGTPLHCVAVSSRPEAQRLFGYVEYFGIHRMVVCLSDDYRGPQVDFCYAVDPTTGKTLPVSTGLNFSDDDVTAIYNYEKCTPEAIKAAYAGVVPTGLRRNYECARDAAVQRAFDHACQTLGVSPDDVLTEEQRWKFTRIIAEQIAAFILRTRAFWQHPGATS